MSESSLPKVSTIRKRIQKIDKPEKKFSLLTAYLLCARVSEVVGRVCPSDQHKTTARGPTGKDVRLEEFKLGPIKEEVAVFTLRTAKRDGKERKIALPTNLDYEPFTMELYDYFKEFGSDSVFPYSPQKVTSWSRKIFDGLNYSIEGYSVTKDGFVVKVPYHFKPFRTHALRHLRTAELIEFYEFDGFDLSLFGGWTLKSTAGIGSVISRYAHLQWKKYFPKLLKERND